MLSLRTATAADYTATCALFEQLDRLHRDAVPWLFLTPLEARSMASFEQLCTGPGSVIWLAEEVSGQQRTVLGAVMVALKEALGGPVFVPQKFAVVDALVVSEGQRGQGIGRSLMNQAEDWAHEHGAAYLHLDVHAFNVEAAHFYAELGYEPMTQRLHKPLAKVMPYMLAERWQRTWQRAGVLPAPGLFVKLFSAYSEPQRHYHCTQHLREVFGYLDSLAASPSWQLEMALWFHDAIYDPRANDTEARSAEWAKAELLAVGVAPEQAHAVAELILQTRHTAAESSNADAALLLDVDLSILGASPERFAQYEALVRAEYAWVPDAIFKRARIAVLSAFLERAQLYNTSECRAQLEQQARQNIAASLAVLSA